MIAPLFAIFLAFSGPYITTDLEMVNLLKKAQTPFSIIQQKGDLFVLTIPDENKSDLHPIAHNLKRCGGFMAFDSLDEATDELLNGSLRDQGTIDFSAPKLSQSSLVQKALAEISEGEIRRTIIDLSTFKNRFYESESGVQSQNYVFEKWSKLINNSFSYVEKIEHPKWPQPTISLTIKGEDPEVVIIGGHGDSISGYFGRTRAIAPGADDNASGIATITEVIRTYLSLGHKPKKTLRFFSYAAEEVGLLGSRAIAKKYKESNTPVAGVLQLDMTNFSDSNEDLVLIDDFTNKGQNEFLANILSTYLPSLKWRYDSCGYACSDHASWHSQGYPASFPFEAPSNERNMNIHTSRDTLDISGGNAEHAEKFAQLAVTYLIEMGQ